MNTTQLRVAGAGLFFLLIFLSGFWLSRSGRPYPGLGFNLHKLIALGAVVFLGLMVSRVHQMVPLGPVQMAAVAITGLLFIGTILTGGLLSTGKSMPAAVSTIHHLVPYLTVLATAAALYLLLTASRGISAG
jgi:hypothetical protein